MKTIIYVLAVVFLPWLGVSAAPTNAPPDSVQPMLGSYFTKTKIRAYTIAEVRNGSRPAAIADL